MTKVIKQKSTKADRDYLYSSILQLKTLGEVNSFFRDLLTEKEIADFSRRWRVAGMLDGKISYSEIEKETGMSSTTIARIHKWLKGGTGGYRLMLQRCKKMFNSKT
jgi:TrpR-related protein YerC/YecD